MENELETALKGTNLDIDSYLEITTTQQIRLDIEDMLKKRTDKSAIKLAIEYLQKLL